LYEQYLTVETPIKKATHQNNAGIIGSAIYAAEKSWVKTF
jgi:hypothetical protein